MSTNVNSQLQAQAKKNISDILTLCFDHDDTKRSVIVYDSECELAETLTLAYKQVLPSATFIHFFETTPEDILKLFSELKAKDLVVLIQSTNFRLNAFRIRVELFKQNLKVIEHPRLNRMIDDQINYYIDSLAYDPQYYRRVGQILKNKIDVAKKCVIDSGDEFLIYDSAFEPAKLNVGDYAELKNIGGQFPIGEVFTEPQNLQAVNGRARVFCFGDTLFHVNKPPLPITLIIENGQIVACENSTEEFETVLRNIRTDEGCVRIRELGFGMNRAFSKDRVVIDIGTYERMCGIHLSLGAKHDSYPKPEFKRGVGRYHVDVFLNTKSVILETDSVSEVVYKDDQWCV